jgi:hypothetical protein
MVFITSLHIFSMGFISGARGGQSMSSTSACLDSHSWTARESWMEEYLVGTGLLHRDKALLQMAPLRVLKCAYTEGRLGDFLYDGVFQPLHGRSNPNNEQTHDHYMWRSTGIESCNALQLVCKLKPPIICRAKCRLVREYDSIPLVIHTALSKC